MKAKPFYNDNYCKCKTHYFVNLKAKIKYHFVFSFPSPPKMNQPEFGTLTLADPDEVG